MEHPHRDEEILRRLYHDEMLNQHEVAGRLGVSRDTIKKWMKRHGIERRTTAEVNRARTIRRGVEDGEETLRELYIEQNLSQREVAEEIGCSCAHVHRKLHEHGIETRPKNVPQERPGFTTSKEGYERWTVRDVAGYTDIRVHRLLAIAAGASPYDVFSGDCDVHHLNDIPWDNRLGNVVLIDADRHREINVQKRWSGGVSTNYLTAEGGDLDE